MKISENHAKLGGGMYLDRCEANHINLNITRNSASEAGGGVYLLQATKFKGSNSTLIGNKIAQKADETNVAPIGGAGVYINGRGFELNGFTISESVSEKGGGIFVESESQGLLKNMVISRNTATESQGGGALFVSADSDVTVMDSEINENNAAQGGGIAVESAHVDLIAVLLPSLVILQ